MIDPTRCTLCNESLANRHKYISIFALQGGGIALKPGCEHLPVQNLELASAVVGSIDCLINYIESWSSGLKVNGVH